MAQVPVVVVLDDDAVAQSGVRQAAERLGSGSSAPAPLKMPRASLATSAPTR